MDRLLRPASRALGVFAGTALMAAGAVVSAAPAQAIDRSTYLTMAISYAKAEQATYRVPASVSIAQSILESGWGNSTLTTRAKNYFGIKCGRTVSPLQTGCYSIKSKEYYDNKAVMQVSAFRVYNSARDSFLDHGRLLTVNSRYSKAFAYTTDPDRFIREVAKAGYATDPMYPAKVITIMRAYNLYQYNRSAPNPTEPAPTPPSTPVTGFPTLAYGAKGSKVRTAQLFLRAHGSKIVADGYYGPKTRDAVRRFQKATRLPITGKIDSTTFAKLTVNVKRGQRGEAVKALQLELRAEGYANKVTGYFGSATEKYLKAHQKKSGLAVTGVAWNSTWKTLLD